MTLRISEDYMVINIMKKIILALLSFSLLLTCSCITKDTKESISLKNSKGNVSAYFIEKLPPDKPSMKSMITGTSEDKIFNELPLIMIRGKIQTIRNVEIDLNDDKLYKALAEISVDKVLRGPDPEEPLIKVLFPHSWEPNAWQEDNEIVQSMDIGTEGIFFLKINDETSYIRQFDSVFMATDLAPYGLMDGVNFAILGTWNGLKYHEMTYPSLEGLKNLDEVEEWILSRIQS